MHSILRGMVVTGPRTFFEQYLPNSLGGDPMDALPEDTIVAFHIEGPDGGAWQLVSDIEGSRILPVAEGPKDCEVWCSSDVFMRIIQGTLASNRAFLSGKLKIAGDIGLALRLEGLLRAAA